jgi:hypothetical protein
VHRLFLVQEQGEVRETVVVQEIVAAALRDLRRFSTAFGLLPIIELPLHTLARGLARLRQHRYIAVWRVKL